MIPYDLDPSLHTAEPEPEVLDDGFSPRHHDEPALPPSAVPPGTDLDVALQDALDVALQRKSLF
jgi:hypothetical protein